MKLIERKVSEVWLVSLRRVADLWRAAGSLYTVPRSPSTPQNAVWYKRVLSDNHGVVNRKKEMVNASTPREVTATLSFIRPDSKFNRRYIAPMAELNTGVYEDKTVVIKDARPNRDSFTLDTGGFVLLDHTSKVCYPVFAGLISCRSRTFILSRAILRALVMLMMYTAPRSGIFLPKSQVQTKSLHSV